MNPQEPKTDFGIFYPMGHIVVAFPSYEDAVRVQKDLLTGGYEREDCALYRSEQVAAASKENLEDHTGWLARLGKSDEMVRKHLEAARHGAAFAVIYAPSDIDAERAMNVVRRVPFEFAHRYRRFAIQVMK
ncbi:MAG TPA: hypothetical protein VML57_01300, partial [Burkholderiales bacterium]|nr:hypothetical protein [Burkholderiales bacterium]